MESWKTIFFIDTEHDPSAHEAVQNEQVCGIISDYKQIFSYNESSYALFPSNLKNTPIIVWEMRPLPL